MGICFLYTFSFCYNQPERKESMMKHEFLNNVIYQVFVRNYSRDGTLKAVTDSLNEIFGNGADILYLMPISPIGRKNRKGSKGSPYSIMDYRSIDEETGTFEDLEELTRAVHSRNGKVILDMVFNHTSCDSLLSKEHPDFFYHDKNGNFANKVGSWADVIDLDHANEALEDYLVDTLKLYEEHGIDGFRFDVASLIPPSFFKKAKEALKKDIIFLGEAIDTSFLEYTRSLGFPAYSNGELCQSGMDLLYPYASFQPLHEFLQTKEVSRLEQFKFAYMLEEASIPQGHYITRAIENHDRERIASYSQDEDFTRSLLSFTFFTPGPAFVYAGEEYKAKETPNLFEKDVISHKVQDKDYYDFYQRLVSLKKRDKNKTTLGSLVLDSIPGTLLLKNTFKDEKEENGFFNFTGKEVSFQIEAGTYVDLLEDKTYHSLGSLASKKALWLKRID